MRIDKYLKVARILKRRTISKELAVNERIEINGRTVKPSHEVKAGDEVTITFGNRQLKIRVLSTEDVKKKKDAADLYEVIGESTVNQEQ
ncbi:MAG: RNA-binding S4 domain-containing protein [Solobacterium sp.]|jgi:ribosomal 50S subunit-recycling heat shock protein|nr:RNA-binding S4 domain-containing protein [Solobacterium sp.]MCH4221867.1 RNA-binding S4 domain-containing protein [Solobacterium sp.]MCH4265190.1 RNA-binding S4 domain-containing protein [Solobacterium sp.]